MPAQVKLMAILTARAGKAEALRLMLHDMAPHSRAEPGNLRWNVWLDQSNAERYVLDELYVDDAAVAAHRETPHFKNYLSQVDDLADRMVLVLGANDVEA